MPPFRLADAVGPSYRFTSVTYPTGLVAGGTLVLNNPGGYTTGRLVLGVCRGPRRRAVPSSLCRDPRGANEVTQA